MSDLSAAKQTPLMKQFWEIKNQHQDKILLFRMGDFYEMFYEDAVTAAPILGIALTSRNKNAEDSTPMCGVPHHSIATPIEKLLAAGLKVAICDQLEDPETAKGIVKRGVTRILSPGMVYDPETLSEKSAHYVAALDSKNLSFLDATTGEAFYYELSEISDSNDRVFELLRVIAPKEIILSRAQVERASLTKKLELYQFYKTEFNDCDEVWPERFREAPESAKRLLTYATHMQGVRVLSTLGVFEKRLLNEHMVLNANTIKHLEIFQTYRGEERGSLYYALNRTKTAAGARLLKSWLRMPLLDLKKIVQRQVQVKTWTQKPNELKILRSALAHLGDIERRLIKISYSNFSVRDLSALLSSVKVGLQVSPFCPGLTQEENENLLRITSRIEQTIVDEPPLNTKLGGYIRQGLRSDLDELILLSDNAQKLLLEMEAREREATQISSLKIRYNNVFGYYIEITNTHKDKAPSHYKRKQTLANAERYITQELHELESKILSSREKRVQLEEAILSDLRDFVLKNAGLLLRAANVWSELDVLTSFSWLGLEQNYVCPQYVMGASYIQLKGSRHPVVEQEVSRTFVSNALTISAGECLLLTGPNMAGKSTLMRQVAIAIIMSQVGSFVPAAEAKLSIFENIYTRIGASDSLSEGLSTFMVEMKETAEMLRAANANTLVVLDEIGRGTSTYDGMSLAQAILEYLINEARAMTLFATHYHEITSLDKVYTQIQNAHMSVVEKGHDIQFLYTLKKGPASESYGVQVAKLAGLPESVISRARELLGQHEKSQKADSREPWQPSLF